MISFYPGPSRVHDEVPRYVKDAFRQGILSMNHRSDQFIDLSKKTISLLHEKLNIPADYSIFFTSSATECWEIIAQSFPSDSSYHIYNGAFGQKWFEYTQRLRSAKGFAFSQDERLDLKMIEISPDTNLICITQNETSNGSQLTNGILKTLRKGNPSAIIAVDATSSMGGIRLNFKSADIWFASVQKCFGLPAGLGLLICSPRAIARAEEAGENNHYNSLTFMIKMMAAWQTSFTPNVLAIYLLKRVLQDSTEIGETNQKVRERYNAWIEFLSHRKSITHLIKTTSVQSFTVIAVTGSPETIQKIKSDAKEQGMLLGEGYGPWKANTFRIANFPALKKQEIKLLMKFLKKY